MEKRHFYTNIDINSSVTPFLNSTALAENPSEELLYPFVDLFADSQITDVLFCTFCQYSATDSNVWTDYSDKYEQKLENGVAVDYYDRYNGIYAWNRKFGIDPYAVWLKRCRERGLKGWLSIRMNDCHCPDDEASFVRGNFFYEARQNGWMVGEHYGYYRNCFDYSVEAVREKMLAYIAEQLDRYDMDGLELDFQREIICFDYVNHPDCAPIMTDFIRKVRALVRSSESKRGHSIRLGIRLMRDIAQNLVYGFDAAAYVREKLVDLIVVTPRWSSSDSDMPISEWKAAFPDTEIAAGLEILSARTCDQAYTSPALARGYALRYLTSGADSMYLFNRFFELTPLNPDALSTDDAAVNRTCGTVEAASALPFRNVMTFQDTVPEGCDGWKPLPVTIAVGDSPKTLSMNLGLIPDGRKLYAVLGFSKGSPADVSVSVNGGSVTDWVPVSESIVEPNCRFRYAEPSSGLYRAEIAVPSDAVLNLNIESVNQTAMIDYFEAEVL